MSHSFFFGKRSNFVQSHSKLYGTINKQIKTIGNINVSGKYYSFLNKKNLDNLKSNRFHVLLKSFGKNYILFLTSYENKNYCVFINKKNLVMNIVQIKFTANLYKGTLMDGEIVKNEDNKYIFLINDIAYYEGESLITKNFEYRHSIIEKIMNNNYELDEDLYIVKKEYFHVNEINHLVNEYMNVLNYKCSGLIFKNNYNFSDNYLFNFPECRSDSKILKNGVTVDNQKVVIEEEENVFGEVENVNQEANQIERTTCKFLINPTKMPDIYELYCYSSNNNIEKHSLASIPDIDTSIYIKSLLNFDNLEENVLSRLRKNKCIYVECNYHKMFKKWIPFQKTDSMDSIGTINKIQILLDSL